MYSSAVPPPKIGWNTIQDGRVEEILCSFPELNNGANGLYNITALQVAAAFMEKGVSSLFGRLLRSGGDVNRGDQLGRTPLHYAVLNGNIELTRLLLNSGADPECKFLYLCSYRTSREDYGKWNKLYSMLPLPDQWGRTPLHEAAKEGHVDIVKLLIKSGANVNVRDEKGVTPLLLAGANKNKSAFEEIVKILIESGAQVDVRDDITETSALFHAVVLKSTGAAKMLLDAGAWLTDGPCDQTELHIAATEGQLEMLELFLNDPRMTVSDVNKPDNVGHSPPYRAAQSSHRECLKLLIIKGSGSLIHATKTGKTVLDAIFSKISRPCQFLREIFDAQISGRRSKDDNYRICLNFSVLAPGGYHSHRMAVISNILVAATDKEKVNILQHPLVESFLRLKWTRIRQFFFLLLFCYAVFVLSLSVYVCLLIHNPNEFEVLRSVAQYFVIVTAGGLSGHAIIQVALSRRNFLKKYEHLMNLVCTLLSLTVAISDLIILKYNATMKLQTSSKESNGVPHPEWILHASSIAVLLAWMEMMLLIGRYPTYGYYALMFAVVLQNVVKVLLTFVCLVIGFALSFSLQMQNSDHFDNPFKALVRTTVMMMGEFEYVQTFSSEGKIPRLPVTSRIIFLFFVVLANIVLMNLMVGLAVSDIQSLREQGLARRLEKQAEFSAHFEKVLMFVVANSRWIPKFISRFLKNRRLLSLKFNVHPEHGGACCSLTKMENKLPTELVESLVVIAKRQNQDPNTVLRNMQLLELVEALKAMLQRSEQL